jgi:hypothetical protein
MEPEMTLETASGVGGSNAAVTYLSDIEWNDDKSREEREDAVWSRARLILRAFDSFCAEHKAYSWDMAPREGWPSPNWSYTLTHDGKTFVTLGKANSTGRAVMTSVAIYELDDDTDELRRVHGAFPGMRKVGEVGR